MSSMVVKGVNCSFYVFHCHERVNGSMSWRNGDTKIICQHITNNDLIIPYDRHLASQPETIVNNDVIMTLTLRSNCGNFVFLV